MPPFAQMVDPRLLKDSGSVFLSGRAAFSSPASPYLLGINPGGKEKEHIDYTVERSLSEWEGRPELWSAFVSEEWKHGRGDGGATMQRRVATRYARCSHTFSAICIAATLTFWP